MLSLDEVLFAGGRHSSSNSAFYLYTGADYFTLSPSGLYSNWSRAAYVYRVQWNSGIFQTTVNSVFGLRPVINLKSSVKIVSGDGTKESPYELSL